MNQSSLAIQYQFISFHLKNLNVYKAFAQNYAIKIKD